MNDIREILEYVISVDGQITFSVFHQNVMREVDSSYHGEYSQIINDWLGYGGFYNSIGNEYYDYNGKIIVIENQIVALVSFEGPFEGEFEPIDVKMTTDIFFELYSRDIDGLEKEKFDPEALYISFDFCEEKGFSGFTANYYAEDDKLIEFHNLMDSKQIDKFQNYFRILIYSNIPRLEFVQNIKENWIACCEENKLEYSITTEYIEFSNLEFSII